VILFARDLVLAMLAWKCGSWAVNSFPVSPALSVEKWSDIILLFLFHPTDMLLSFIYFGAACWLLYKILARHGSRLFHGTALLKADWILHLLVCLFALFVVSIQLVKITFPTLAVVLLLAVTRLYGAYRSRVWKEEISELIDKK